MSTNHIETQLSDALDLFQNADIRQMHAKLKAQRVEELFATHPTKGITPDDTSRDKIVYTVLLPLTNWQELVVFRLTDIDGAPASYGIFEYNYGIYRPMEVLKLVAFLTTPSKSRYATVTLEKVATVATEAARRAKLFALPS